MVNQEKKTEIIGMRYKQAFIVAVVISIALAMFGFVLLHVVLNNNYDAFYFFMWPLSRITVIDIGFTCFGIALFIMIVVFLELVINTNQMVKIGL